MAQSGRGGPHVKSDASISSNLAYGVVTVRPGPGDHVYSCELSTRSLAAGRLTRRTFTMRVDASSELIAIIEIREVKDAFCTH